MAVHELRCLRSMFFFFFQAEDGIRDLTVTGVQTCALPLSFLIFLPVVRVPSQKDVGAGRGVRDIEGAGDGGLLFGRMVGEEVVLIKEALESCLRSGKGDVPQSRNWGWARICAVPGP